MIVIDTPGMLHPPKGKHMTPQQRAIGKTFINIRHLYIFIYIFILVY